MSVLSPKRRPLAPVLTATLRLPHVRLLRKTTSMKTISATLLLMALFLSLSSQSRGTAWQSAKGIDQELRNLTRKLDQAFVRKDFATLEYLLSDHYAFLGLPKKEFIAALKSKDTTYEYVKRDIIRVNVHDDIAVVSGLLSQRGGSRGVAPYTSEFGFAEVWARIQGNWQCVSTWIGDAEQSSSKKEGIRVGPELQASLVVYFKAGVTDDQITKFLSDLHFVLTLSHRLIKDEREICNLLRIYPAFQKHERMALTFCEATAKEDRENITKVIKSSSLVYKVLENIAPVDVRSIDE